MSKPLAFLATGRETLDDVLADARAAFPLGYMETELLLGFTPGTSGYAPLRHLRVRIQWARDHRGHLGANVAAGLTWRAYRVAKAAEVTK